MSAIINMVDVDWTNEAECLAAVKQDGFNIKNVVVQTAAICYCAVEQQWQAFEFVSSPFTASAVKAIEFII